VTLASGACALLGIVLTTRPAYADATFALSCRSDPRTKARLSESILSDAVEHELDRKPFTSADQADVLLEGMEVFAGHGRFRARIAQRDRDGRGLGEREIEARSCKDLLRSAALVVALFVDPDANRQPEDDGGDRATKPPMRSSDVEPRPYAQGHGATPPRRARPKTAETRQALGAFSLWLGGGAGAAVGVLPSPSAVLFGESQLQHERSPVRFEWRGRFHLQQHVGTGAIGGDFSAFDQQLAACIAPLRHSVSELQACGGLVVGAIFPKTRGVRHVDDGPRVIVAPVAALAFPLRSGAAAGRLEVAVAFPSRSYTFTYVNAMHERELFYSTGSIFVLVSVAGLYRISS